MLALRRRRTDSTIEREFVDDLKPQPPRSAQVIGNNSSPKPGTKIPPEEMTCQDRTNEFMSTVKSMQGRQLGNGSIPQKDRFHTQNLQHWGEFTLIAKQIGSDIANTFSKLEKLTLLAKRKSLFDDRPVEIQELTYIIKQDIGSLNKQIAQLQQLTRSRGIQSNGSHMQKHSNSVVVSLQSKLASISNDFKQVLEVRTQNLKHQKSRREQFTQGSVSSALPASAMAGHHTGSVLLADDRAHQNFYHNNNNNVEAHEAGAMAINMDSQRPPQYQQQMQLLDEQDAYVQSRADTMQNIESTIVELGSIFQQLAHMVKEQEEIVQRIDSNVEDTQLNVEAAHSEILKYFQSVTSNRWLMIKIFGVLIVFFIIFVVFVA